MGNIFDTCKSKKNNVYNSSLFEPLQNNDAYSSINLYNNLDFIELNEKIDKIKKRVDFGKQFIKEVMLPTGLSI